MNKNQGLLLGIVLMLLFTSIALATSTTISATSDVIIYAFDQDPAGSDDCNEWLTFHNPPNGHPATWVWVLKSEIADFHQADLKITNPRFHAWSDRNGNPILTARSTEC